MSALLARIARHPAWTAEEISDLPDEGFRYEIVDGRLRVSIPPDIAHVAVAIRLREILTDQAPQTQVMVQRAGLRLGVGPADTLYSPDLTVISRVTLDRKSGYLRPAEVGLVVEVLSPLNVRFDRCQKRFDYAAAGIPEYWMVDPEVRSLIVMSEPDENDYRRVEEIAAGQVWRSETPFMLEIDPAEII